MYVSLEIHNLHCIYITFVLQSQVKSKTFTNVVYNKRMSRQLQRIKKHVGCVCVSVNKLRPASL